MNKQILWAAVFVSLISIGSYSFAESEPNNTIETANEITIADDTGSSTGALDTAGSSSDTIDVYKITVPSDGYLQIGVVPTKDLNVEVLLKDTNGITDLAYKNDTGNGGMEAIVYPNLRAGTYYAVVKIPDGNDPVQGSYDIALNYVATEEIDQEPNDTPGQAVEMPAAGKISGHLGYAGSNFTDIRDYFKITLPKDGKLVLTGLPDGTLSMDIGLYDIQLFKNISWTGTGGKGSKVLITYNNLLAGTYIVYLSRNDGAGSYTLTSLYTEDPSPDTEPNDSTATAFAVDLSAAATAKVQGRLGYYGNQVSDDNDYFKVTTPAYGKLSLKFAMDAGDGLGVGYNVFDSSLRYIRGSGDDNAVFEGLLPGTYYIRMYKENGWGSYTLNFAFEKQDQPQAVQTNATEIYASGAADNITVSQELPVSWFRITMPNDGKLSITTQFTNTGYLYVNLFHGDGISRITGLDHWGTNDKRNITVPNLCRGTYMVQVSRYDGSTVGSLVTEVTPVVNIDAEPDDEITTQAPVALNQSYVGHLGYYGNGWTDNLDYYLMDVPEDGSLNITLTGEPTGYFYIDLMSMDGNRYTTLSHADSWGTSDPRPVGKPNIKAGKYLLQLSRYDGYSQYAFDIKFTPNRSNDPVTNGDDWGQATEIALTPYTNMNQKGYVGHIGYDRNFYNNTSDYYKIHLPEDGSLFVNVQMDSTSYIYWKLLNADLRTVAADQRDSWGTNNPRQIGSQVLRAGWYYFVAERYDQYGTYQIYLDYKPAQFKDVDSNWLASQAPSLQLGQLAQGMLGYRDLNYIDKVDWYRVDVSTKGRYKLLYQTTHTMYSYIELFSANMVTRLVHGERWGTADPYVAEVDLDPGTYFVKLIHYDGYGAYNLIFGDTSSVIAAKLKGKVTSKSKLPLAEIDVAILNKTVKTNAMGEFTIENVPPGTYNVSFVSGAKYYPENTAASFTPGQDTIVNMIMNDSSKTAPNEVEQFYGITGDQYIHFMWSHTTTPGIEDGGGYKLYIDNNAPIVLGYKMRYASLGFVNGQTYTCRLTVYDKYGDESTGKTIVVTPSGTSVNPVPTPTLPAQPTPTNTPMVAVPTPTPTATNVPGQPTNPVPTNTPAAVIDTPTPTPTTNPAALKPVFTFEFDKGAIGECGWGDTMLGGFSGNPAGFIKPGFPLVDNIFTASKDKKGLMISVKPVLTANGLDEVCFVNSNTLIETRGLPVLIVAYVQAENAQNNASIYVGALKGDFAKGGVDGSISYHAPANSINFTLPKRICCLYEPDGGVQMITPFIQIAAKKNGGNTTVYIDRVEIYLLQADQNYPGSLFTSNY